MDKFQEIFNMFLNIINFNDIVYIGSSTISMIYDIFIKVVLESPLIIVSYFGLVLIGVLLYNKTRNTYEKLGDSFVQKINKILYDYAILIEKNKGKIYDFQETVKILYDNKNIFFKSEYPSYITGLSNIKKDVVYIEELLGVQLTQKEERELIENIKVFLVRAKSMCFGIQTFLYILTLGLFKLFSKNLTQI